MENSAVAHQLGITAEPRFKPHLSPCSLSSEGLEEQEVAAFVLPSPMKLGSTSMVGWEGRGFAGEVEDKDGGTLSGLSSLENAKSSRAPKGGIAGLESPSPVTSKTRGMLKTPKMPKDEEAEADRVLSVRKPLSRSSYSGILVDGERKRTSRSLRVVDVGRGKNEEGEGDELIKAFSRTAALTNGAEGEGGRGLVDQDMVEEPMVGVGDEGSRSLSVGQAVSLKSMKDKSVFDPIATMPKAEPRTPARKGKLLIRRVGSNSGDDHADSKHVISPRIGKDRSRSTSDPVDGASSQRKRHFVPEKGGGKSIHVKKKNTMSTSASGPTRMANTSMTMGGDIGTENTAITVSIDLTGMDSGSEGGQKHRPGYRPRDKHRGKRKHKARHGDGNSHADVDGDNSDIVEVRATRKRKSMRASPAAILLLIIICFVGFSLFRGRTHSFCYMKSEETQVGG
ncbi:hypothetical protein AX15_003281 [Amanita polypyramis BW_CC]|nr:hypothetical protein AX15_003281 [Amanita polypyramis BW_CC]